MPFEIDALFKFVMPLATGFAAAALNFGLQT
jgi:hypothetical protein